MKVRVVKEAGWYNVEVKRWFWPFWIEVAFSGSQQDAIEKAVCFADPSRAVVWTNKDLGTSPCK